MARRHRDCILAVTVERRQAAVVGGAVASVHVSVFARSDNLVGFSNRRGAPGHHCIATGGGDRHVLWRTRLCEWGDVSKSAMVIGPDWQMLAIATFPVFMLNLLTVTSSV